MRLDYGTITSPYPICLSIGTIRKPTLGEIADQNSLGFGGFGLYETFIAMTPELYYTEIDKELGKKMWEPLSEAERDSVNMLDVICQVESLQKLYTDMLQFFFVEMVVFQSGVFVILKNGTKPNGSMSNEDIIGVITRDSFKDVMNILKQICGMQPDEEEDASQMKFKNKMAQKLFERMKQAKKLEKKTKKHDPNLSLPNIISSVCARHPSINYTNVYQLTVYQLIDTFERLRNDAFYEIDKTRVSVWGDEKKTFRSDAWYKNEYDKK